MITKKQIDDFFSSKQIVIAGVSRDKTKFGYQVFEDLKKKKYTVYPVNPNAAEIENEKCYTSLPEETDKLNRLIILTPVHKIEETFHEAVKKGYTNIWIHHKEISKNIIDTAREKNINLIRNKCVFMFAEPVTGIHAFHRWFIKISGRFPE
jgi:hypothetical protein